MSLSSLALSVLAFGVSKYVGSGDFSESVYSELGVGSLGDIFKSGSEKALSKFFKNPPPDFDKDKLNHHLNKAARVSLLLATFYACRGALLEYGDRESKKEETIWLSELAESLKSRISKTYDEKPESYIKDEDILSIFKSFNDTTKIEKELISKLHEETFNLIRTDEKSFSLYNQSGFELLKKNIVEGWEEQLSPVSPRKKYDWLSLVCGIFNDECKNPTIGFALQNNLFRNLLETLGDSGTSFELLCKEIAEISKATYRHTRRTEFLIKFSKDFKTEVFVKLEDISKKLNRVEAKLDGRIFTEPKITHNFPNSGIKAYGRDNEAKFLR